MVNAVLSPCLYLIDNDIKNLYELIEVLEFIEKYLDVNLDIMETSILCEQNWYSLPKYKPTIYNQFSVIVVPLLKKISNRIIHFNAVESFSLLDSSYIITDMDEFHSVLEYILGMDEEYIIFVGAINERINDTFEIKINNRLFEIPVVKNVWFDESGNYDDFIKESIKDYDSVFPNKEICSKIGTIALENGNKSIFKKYGNIVAERNGYHKLPYTPRQYKNFHIIEETMINI